MLEALTGSDANGRNEMLSTLCLIVCARECLIETNDVRIFVEKGGAGESLILFKLEIE